MAFATLARLLMPSLVVTALAERSPAELESVRGKMQAELTRLTVELEQVEAAIALQQRTARGQASGRRGKTGKTRERILAIVGESTEPVGPAYIRDALATQDEGAPKGGSIYSIIQRMAREGDLLKIADGQYTLPSQNGPAEPNLGPTENEGGESLSTATHPQEGN
jgi:hypothetical protein